MYIDPNTGGMLFQILAVMFGVFSAVILFFSGRIRTAFAKMRRKMRERRNPGVEIPVPDEQTPPPPAA
jgi:hypothetical protein